MREKDKFENVVWTDECSVRFIGYFIHTAGTRGINSHGKKLPAYIVNCLVAAGYDTLPVIASINTSKEPGNTLEEIENFINREYPEDCQSLPTQNSRNCKFLPGHRQLIDQFVKDL